MISKIIFRTRQQTASSLHSPLYRQEKIGLCWDGTLRKNEAHERDSTVNSIKMIYIDYRPV